MKVKFVSIKVLHISSTLSIVLKALGSHHHQLFDLWMTLISTFSVPSSVTRLGDLLHFGQLFKASSNNYFAKIAHIFGNFCIGVKIFQFSSEIIIGQLLETLGNFLLVTLVPSCLTFSLQRTLMKLILVFHS